MERSSRAHVHVPVDDAQRVRIGYSCALRQASDLGCTTLVVAVDQRGTLFGSISNGLGDDFSGSLLSGTCRRDGLEVQLTTARSKKRLDPAQSVLLALFTKEAFTDQLMKLGFAYSVYVPLHWQEQQSYLLSYGSRELPVNA